MWCLLLLATPLLVSAVDICPPGTSKQEITASAQGELSTTVFCCDRDSFTAPVAHLSATCGMDVVDGVATTYTCDYSAALNWDQGLTVGEEVTLPDQQQVVVKSPSVVTTEIGRCTFPAFSKNRRKLVNIVERQQNVLLNDNPACPKVNRACPLPSGNFECMDFDELLSCGGCLSEGTGVNCLQIPGIENVQCLDGECAARSCLPGWTLRSGQCELKTKL
ncbi:priA protein precursor [Pseudohyphozyma bogoriensis]|nr:priA protein precursor [Pseudohyphozyma bogoriensis]